MNQLSSNTPLTDKLIAENSIFCDSDNLCKLRDHACILELRILAKDKLIEQMREALRAWTKTPDLSLHEAIKKTEATLSAAERPTHENPNK